ncbi:MAG: hypothetical protein ACI8Z5_000843 [Lentimonas sp.]|jgi:hypothetical protein
MSSAWIEATPAAGDLDNDGLIEIIYASYDGRLYRTELATLQRIHKTRGPASAATKPEIRINPSATAMHSTTNSNIKPSARSPTALTTPTTMAAIMCMNGWPEPIQPSAAIASPPR